MEAKYLLFAFIALVSLYQLYKHDPQQAFFIACIIGLVAGFYVTNRAQAEQILGKLSDKIEAFTSDEYVTKAEPREISSSHYQIYKYPSSTKYSYRIREFKTIMKSLEFLYVYDEEKLNRVKAISEAFFKTHFNVMMGKYDPALYVGELNDFKIAALSAMREFVFVIPKVSTVIDIPDLHSFVEKKIIALNELFSRYIRIVAHAFPDAVVTRHYEPPFENDYDALAS